MFRTIRVSAIAPPWEPGRLLGGAVGPSLQSIQPETKGGPMPASNDCLFCKIVAGEIPSTPVYQDEAVTAFRDINPQAPKHLLLVPSQHIVSTDELQPEHDQL